MAEDRIYLQVTDDDIRHNEGVVACLIDLGNGESRLIFDDVVAQTGSRPRTWRHKSFYTSNTFDSKLLDGMDLSDVDFMHIGEALVARLLAINRRIP